jgi:Concanavalin A-like lectin/glucanases superfamily/Leucine rich repeat/Leucine Rich repeat
VLLIGGGVTGAVLLLRDRGKEPTGGANGPQPPAAGAKLPTPLVEWSDKDAGGAPAAGARGLQVFVRGKLVRVVPLTQPIREKSLEVWFTISDLEQQSTTLVQIDDGVQTWDGILYADQDRREWYPGSSFRHRSGKLKGPVETAQPTDLVHLVMVYQSNGAIALWRNGESYGYFRPKGPDGDLRAYPTEGSRFAIGADAEGKNPFQGEVKLARLYDRALPIYQVEALFNDGKARLSGQPERRPPPGEIVPPGDSVPPGGQRPPGDKPEPSAKEREAIDALTKLFVTDNKFIVNAQAAGRPVVGVDLANNYKITDADLAHLKALPELETLDLLDCEKIGDKGIAEIKSLTRLRELNLNGTKVSDKGLAEIAGLKELRKLVLEDTRIGDAGVAHLKGLGQLEVLVLSNTSVTDAALADVSGLAKLKWLWLTDTRVTDKGLDHLKKLSSLEILNVIGTKVTERGAADLKKSLPKLQIYLR